MFTILYSSNRSKFVSETTFGKDTFFEGKEIGNHKFMKLYILFFCFLSIAVSYGQDYCNPAQRPMGVGEGGFTIVGKSIGCRFPFFDVTVEKTVGQSPLYLYDYKGGDPTKAPYTPLNATTFRYTKEVFIKFYNSSVTVREPLPVK